jgi:GT2 family glycosyltransferase
MISVIVSTYKPHLLQQLSENIAETIGVEYELIAIQNNAQYSLCEVYNMGVAKAKYDYYCFVHEDVLFKVNNWGQRLVSMMETDSSIGLIGVAGTKFRSSYPSALGQSPRLSQFRRGHIFQWITKEGSGYVHLELDENNIKKEIEDVVCIDGVCMFSKKDVFKHCRFDDAILKQFHGYDIDFSLQVFFAGFRVLVDRTILIYHASVGSYDKNNTIANRVIAKKWWHQLPVVTKDTNLSKIKISVLNYQNWTHFLVAILKRKLSRN